VAERSYLSIGEVLALLKSEFPDVTISKIRFLESQGLIAPERTPSGYRKFYDPDVERLRWILRQQRENFLPLKVIKGRLNEDGEADDAADEQAETEAEAPTPAATPARSPHAVRAEPPAPIPRPTGPSPAPPGAATPEPTALDLTSAGPTSVSMTIDELANATSLPAHRLSELERYGLLAGHVVGGTAYYDEDAVVVAKLAAGFLDYGVEARHLKMYKSAAEREVGLFEAVVLPMLKQRNPQARKQALVALTEMSRLGQNLRAAMVRQALKDYLAGP
jgi:DNA-binding transcriptional MerR regulator